MIPVNQLVHDQTGGVTSFAMFDGRVPEILYGSADVLHTATVLGLSDYICKHLVYILSITDDGAMSVSGDGPWDGDDLNQAVVLVTIVMDTIHPNATLTISDGGIVHVPDGDSFTLASRGSITLARASHNIPSEWVTIAASNCTIPPPSP